MAKVYVVTNGAYENYEIVGVFSTRKKAHICKESYASENQIETYELDAGNFEPYLHGYFYWSVYITPETTLAYKDNPHDDDNALSPEVVKVWGTQINAFSFTVYAKDEKHAVKIASERRSQLIASGEVDAYFAKKKEILFGDHFAFVKTYRKFDIETMELPD